MPQGGDRLSHKTEAHADLIHAALNEVPDITLPELKARLGAQGGMAAPFVLDGAMNRCAFETYVARVLVPELRPGDVVIMDNLSSHKGPRVRELIEAAGASLRYLPPYSPDFNPIENAFAKLKARLRKAALRSRTDDAHPQQEMVMAEGLGHAGCSAARDTPCDRGSRQAARRGPTPHVGRPY